MKKAEACQGALEDGLQRGTVVGAGSCCRWQLDELWENLQLHPLWSYDHGFVLMATVRVPEGAAGRREAICFSSHRLV